MMLPALNPFSETTFITFVSCSIFSKRSFNASNGLLWAPRILQPRDSFDIDFHVVIRLQKMTKHVFQKKVWNRACDDGRATLEH